MNPYKHLQSVLEHPGSLQHNYFGSITSWLLDIIECSRKFHACMEAWLSILEISRYLSNSSYPEHHPRWIQDCKSSYKIPRYWWNWHTLYTCENLEHTHRWLKLYDVLCYLPAVSSKELRRGKFFGPFFLAYHSPEWDSNLKEAGLSLK